MTDLERLEQERAKLAASKSPVNIVRTLELLLELKIKELKGETNETRKN